MSMRVAFPTTVRHVRPRTKSTDGKALEAGWTMATNGDISSYQLCCPPPLLPREFYGTVVLLLR